MNERIELSRAQCAVDAEREAVTGLLVMLEVGGRPMLLIRLGVDGGIHRHGSGSLERVDRDRFIGTTTPETFRRVAAKITPQLLEWCGQSRAHPAPRGELCDLVIVFKRADGRESMTAWRYGTHSKWPPPEVLEFVDAAVEATCPWYEEQKKQLRLRTERAEYAWWHFFTLPQA